MIQYDNPIRKNEENDKNSIDSKARETKQIQRLKIQTWQLKYR